MNKLLSTMVIAAAAYVPFAAHATTIDFESGLDPFFSYSSVAASTELFPFDSGYLRMQNHTGSLGFAFNPSAESPSTFTGTSHFDLVSFLIDGAWGTQTLTINGLLDGNVKFTEQVFIYPEPQLVTLNWSGIDAFVISTGDDFLPDPEFDAYGRHWVMDNLLVNEHDAAVPEPATLGLFGLGMLGWVVCRRKKATPFIEESRS